MIHRHHGKLLLNPIKAHGIQLFLCRAAIRHGLSDHDVSRKWNLIHGFISPFLAAAGGTGFTSDHSAALAADALLFSQIILRIFKNGITAPAEFTNAIMIVFVKRRDHGNGILCVDWVASAFTGFRLIVALAAYIFFVFAFHSLTSHILHNEVPIAILDPFLAFLRDHLIGGQILYFHAAQCFVQPAQRIPVDMHKRSAVQICFSLVGIVHGFHGQLLKPVLQHGLDSLRQLGILFVQRCNSRLRNRGIDLALDQLIHHIPRHQSLFGALAAA